jgi:hypothetical protein
MSWTRSEINNFYDAWEELGNYDKVSSLNCVTQKNTFKFLNFSKIIFRVLIQNKPKIPKYSRDTTHEHLKNQTHSYHEMMDYIV